MTSFSLRFVWVSLCIFLCCAAGCSGCDFDLDFWGDDDPDECSSDADCFGGTCLLLNDGNRCDSSECSRDEDCGCGQLCNSLGECELDQFVNPCPICEEEGEPCESDFDCCSGLCDDFGACAEEPFLSCVEAGQSCSEQDECCQGVCAEGVCAAEKCVPGGEPAVVADGVSTLALSEDASALYWVSEGKLHSIPKVGGEVTQFATGAGAGGCISRFGNHTTWCGDDGDIWQLIDGDDAPVLLAVAATPVSALVDSAGGLFWSEASGAVMRAQQSFPTEPQVLATAISGSPPIAVDASSVFYADGATVNAVPLDGGVVSPLFTGAGPIAALAQDAERVYFVDASTMTALGKTDGSPSVIGFAESARKIALSKTHVYYADTFIARIPKTGGTTVALVNEAHPTSLLVDDQCVYWVDADQGRIMKVARD